MKAALTILFFLSISSCQINRYAEPVRLSYQLNKYGQIALSNSVQFFTQLINEREDKIEIYTRNILKNLDQQKNYDLLFSQAYMQFDNQKIPLNCHQARIENVTEYTLISGKSILFECQGFIQNQKKPKDQFIEAHLPVKQNEDVKWSFIIKAEDLK